MYKWMILLSLVLGLLTASYVMYRRKVPRNNILMSVFLNLLLMFYGAIAVTYFISSGAGIGLNSSGGAVGMIIGTLIFSLITPEYKKDYFASYILALPLIYGIGKIGCSSAGCCGGIHYTGPLAIMGVKGMPVFPIQITEAIVFLGLFAISFAAELKGKYEPFIAAIIYSLAKILLDFLRDTHSTKVVTANQYLCMFVIVFCLFLKWGISKRKERIR